MSKSTAFRMGVGREEIGDASLACLSVVSN